MKINKIIKTIRKKKNLRQEDIAKIININTRTYSDWENGNIKRIPFEYLEKIANICGYEIIFKEKNGNDIITSKNIDRKEL